jgi:hypothetical protein
MIALSFLLLVQNMAQATPTNALKQVYDDYVYALTVEWDQVNEAELQAIHAEFDGKLTLLREAGILNEASVKELLKGELPAALTAGQELSEVKQILEQYILTQNRGASWDGTRGLLMVVGWGFLPALIIIYAITTSGRKEMCSLPTNYPYGVPFECN